MQKGKTMKYKEIKKDLKWQFLACIDECGEFPDMSQVIEYLTDEYKLTGGQAVEIVKDLFR